MWLWFRNVHLLSLLVVFFVLFNMTTASQQPTTESQEALGLPPPTPREEVRKLDLTSGSQTLTDELGPLVINKDGTTARITNWDTMTSAEKERTIRILSKRNRERMAKLKEEL